MQMLGSKQTDCASSCTFPSFPDNSCAWEIVRCTVYTSRLWNQDEKRELRTEPDLHSSRKEERGKGLQANKPEVLGP